MEYTTFLRLSEDALYSPLPVSEGRCPFSRDGYCVVSMPQFQLWDLPGSGADSFVEGFSVNRPAQGGLRRSRYDRNRGHEVVMQSNCAAAAYTLDRLRIKTTG